MNNLTQMELLKAEHFLMKMVVSLVDRILTIHILIKTHNNITNHMNIIIHIIHMGKEMGKRLFLCQMDIQIRRLKISCVNNMKNTIYVFKML